MKEKLTTNNQSVEKAFQIIEEMAKNKGSMRLQDISNKLGLPSSTVLRFLNTLIKYNYVSQDPETLKYSLTMKFCRIGNLVSSQFSLRDVVRPYLLELSEKCGESACLAIEQDMMAVYIDVVEGPEGILKVMQRIGKLAPLHSTGVGKILLLNYDEKELDNLIRSKGLPKITENTITTRDRLLSELDRIRESGYSLDNEECEIGARCIAAPIKDYSGKIIASMSLTGPINRMTSEKIERVKTVIMELSREISKKLAFDENEKL